MIDESLIAQAQLKATGANIHRVTNRLAIYKMYHDQADSQPEDEREQYFKIAEKSEKILRAFVVTGRLP